MTRIQQFEIDGQMVWVEVADVPVSAPPQGSDRFSNTSAGSGPANAVAKAVEKADIAATLKTVVGSVQQAMSALKPDKINVELTLGFKADVGVFIASGEANAQVKVSAKWKPAAVPPLVEGREMVKDALVSFWADGQSTAQDDFVGCGFFIAPGKLLTAAHVARTAHARSGCGRKLVRRRPMLSSRARYASTAPWTWPSSR